MLDNHQKWMLGAALALISLGLIGWSNQGENLREMQRKALASEMAALNAERYVPLRDAWTIYADSTLSGFLTETTPEDALVALAEQMAKVAKDQRIDWKPATRSAEMRNGLIEARISGAAILPEAQLAAYLAALEVGTPYVFIEKAHLIRQQGANETDARVTLNLTALAYAPIKVAEPATKTEPTGKGAVK